MHRDRNRLRDVPFSPNIHRFRGQQQRMSVLHYDPADAQPKRRTRHFRHRDQRTEHRTRHRTAANGPSGKTDQRDPDKEVRSARPETAIRNHRPSLQVRSAFLLSPVI